MGKMRKPGSKRGRTIPLLMALGIGYVMGAWHVAALQETDGGSAAQAVALRFPTEWTKAESASNRPVTRAAARSAAAAAIFSPVPMAPPMSTMAPMAQEQAAVQQPAAESFAAQSPDPQVAVQTASLENTVALPARTAAEVTRPAANPIKSAKTSAAAGRPAANRPGYVLDDAQIASIKARLHLTPDQEQMWPAVEAALRNIAYRHTQQARERGAASMQADAFDPNAVQGLKSAAVPLIMSFNEEQKEEVRDIAHVIGLDQLATQF